MRRRKRHTSEQIVHKAGNGERLRLERSGVPCTGTATVSLNWGRC